ncbi:collagen binding domain-containing protein, partial [Caryophanon latum]|uniref:collagen binding domain-containing protein n=1 Tax=Caryophanon latum TaxID=33977 RepID=UPI000A0255CA
MFKKINVFVLLFFLFVQSFVMPVSASAASFDSVSLAAAIAATQANDDEEGSTPTGTTQPATTAAATEPLIDLSFDKLVHNGDKVTDQDDADDLEPKAGDKVELHYTFEVVKDMKVDDTFTFKLPQQLLLYNEEALKGNIEILNDEGKKELYFTYRTNKDTREVTITALKAVEAIQGLEGEIFFTATFGNFETQELEQTLVIEDSDSSAPNPLTLTFKFEPLVDIDDATIVKDGTVRDDKGVKYIDWQVAFNLEGEELGESITFNDTLGEGHELVPGSVNVSLVKMKATLQSVQPDSEGEPIVLLTDGSELNFEIESGNNESDFVFNKEIYAVQVTYTTEITRIPDSAEEIFENVVKASSGKAEWEAEAAVPVTYGTPLSKTFVGGNKYKANWKIEFNKLGQTVTPGMQITDTVSEEHKILADTIKVTKYEQVDGQWVNPEDITNPSLISDEGEQSFKILLIDNGTYAYDIEYSTASVDDLITSSGTIENTVTSPFKDANDEPYTATDSFIYSSGVGVKELRSIDYTNRTVEWYVSFTSEGQQIPNFNLTDQLPSGLTLKPYDDGKDFNLLKGEVSGANSNVNLKHENGIISASVADTATVDLAFTYQTTYDTLPAPGANGKVEFSNTANFTWKNKDGTPDKLDKSAVFEPILAHVANAEKSGTYNYATRTFHWTAGVNLDRKAITNITDTLGTGHKLVADSVKVYNAKIGTDGSVTKGEATDDFTITKTDTSFTLTPKSATSKPYYIEYETKDADHIIGQEDGSGLYENKIVVNNGVETTASVTIDRPNELVTKTGNPIVANNTIDWIVDVNRSGSLLENAVLTDTLAANTDAGYEHFLLPDTVKIQPLKFTKNGIENDGNPKTLDQAIEAGWLTALPMEPEIRKNTSFKLTFGDLTDDEGPQAFRITYSTYYDGKYNEEGAYGNKAVLTSGSQTLPEENASAGVELKDGKYINNDSGASADFKRANVSITKLGVNNDTGEERPLPNVTFELYNKSGTILLQTVTTVLDGKEAKATFEKVGYGIYILKEVTALDGYKKVSELKLTLSANPTITDKNGKNVEAVEIIAGTQPAEGLIEHTIKVKNEEIVNSIEMTKTFEGVAADADDKLLEQVKFALFKEDGTRVTTTKKAEYDKKNGTRTLVEDQSSADLTFTPDADGKVYVPYLDNGRYYFQEVETALGYQLDNTKFEGFINSDSVKKTNTWYSPVNKPLEVTVTNVEGDPDDETPPTNTDPKIKGSTFEVYAVTENVCEGPGKAFTPTEGQTPVKIDGADFFTTDENGQVTIDFSKIDENQTAKQYVIVQKHVVGEGEGSEYKESYFVDRPFTIVECIDFTKPDQPTNPIFENERIADVTLEIVKTDADSGEAMQGIVFTITAPEAHIGSFVGKTDADGKVTKWFKGTTYPEDDSTGAVNPPRAKYALAEELPAGYENLVVVGSEEDIINFTKDTTSFEATNEKIKRDINVFDTCTLGERVYEIHTADGQQALQKDGTLKATVAYEDNKENEDVVRFVIPAGKTFDEAVNKGDLVIPEGSYEIVQVYTEQEECKQDSRPFTVTPDDPTPTNETFGDNVAIIQFKTCGEGELAESYVFEKDGQQYTATLDENGQAIVKMPVSASDTDYYTLTIGNKTIKVIVPELSGDAQPITIYTEDCSSEVEVELEAIDGKGCLENGAEVTVTLQDAQGKAIQTLTAANGQTYAVYNNEVIINNQLFNVNLSKDATTVTVNGTSYTVSELAPKTITKGTEPTTALFDNLMPGDYKVVVTGGDCLSAPPTVTVPPGEKTNVPVEEVPGEPGNLDVPIQFVGGLGCLTDSSVTVSLRSNGEPVQQITIGDKTYGVLKGKVIVNEQFYSAAADGTFTIDGETYIPALYEQTITKPGFAKVEANFTNLMPGEYEVIVSVVECIVPAEPTPPPTVTVPPGDKTEVPFEEKPKQPGTLEVKVDFIGGAGCLEDGEAVALTLFSIDSDGNETAVNYVEIDGTKYGVLNNEVLIGDEAYEIVEGSVTIEGQATAVEAKPYIVTVTKPGLNEPTAVFTNLVPGKYVVKVIDNECITTDEPTVDVPPGVQTPPTVEFDEKPKQPGSLEVPVQFAGGQGCTENGDITVTLQDANGKDVQAVTIDGKQYGISNDQIIVDGAAYVVVSVEGEEAVTFTNLATGQQLEKDGEAVTSTKTVYTQTVTKDGANKATATFENLIPGDYTVKVTESECIVPTEPTTPPTVTVPPGDKEEIPFEETPNTPGDANVIVQFAGGQGCLENGDVTLALQYEGKAVQAITIDGETYGILNDEVIVEGQVYKVTSNKVTIQDKEYEVAPYEVTVKKTGANEATAQFTNLVPGDKYTVVAKDENCNVSSEPFTPGTGEEVPAVPVNETPNTPGDADVTVQFAGGQGCLENGDVTLALQYEGKAVQAITIGDETYGILNGEVIVDGQVYVVVTNEETNAQTVTINGETYTPAPYEVTVSKSGANKAEATFTNLVPGDKYTVVAKDGNCNVSSEPFTPGTGEEVPTVPVNETPNTPGDADVTVQFAGGQGCLENGDVTLALQYEGKAVQAITIGDETYGILNGEVIVNGQVYVVVTNEETNAQTVTINGETYNAKPYEVTVSKSGTNKAEATFTNLLPGDKYTVVAKDENCNVSSEPFTPGTGEEVPAVPVNETPTTPGNVEVAVEFIEGVGCLEDGTAVTATLQHNSETVKAITIGGTTYGILNNEVIVDGQVYEVIEGKVTIAGQTYDAAAYTVTITEETPTAQFTNLVPGEYTVHVTNENCIVPTNFEDPTTPPSVNVPPGKTPSVPFEETAKVCTETVIKAISNLPETAKTVVIGENEVAITEIPTTTAPGTYDVKNEAGNKIGSLIVKEGNEAEPCVTATFEALTCENEFVEITNAPETATTVVIEGKEVAITEIPTTTAPGTYDVKNEAGNVIGQLVVEAGTEEQPCVTATFEALTCENEFVEVPPNLPETATTVTIDGEEVPVSDIPMGTPPGTYPVKDKDGNEIGEIEIIEPTEEEPCPTAEFKPAPTPEPLVCTTFTLQVNIDGKLVPTTTEVKLVSTTNPTVFVLGTANEEGIVTYNDPFTLVPGQYEVVINDVVYGTVEVAYGEEPCEAKIFDGKTPEELPETPTPPTTCTEEFVKVPENVPSDSTVIIDGEEVSVSDIPMGTPPGTYPVKDKDGNEIGEITIVEPTEDDLCPTAEFKPAPTPEPPSCTEEFVKVPENVPSDSKVTIDGEEVSVSDIPMNTPPGTYPVKDKDGNEIGEIEIIEPTEDEPCPTAVFEPAPTPEPPSCTEEFVKVPENVPSDSKVTIDGEEVPVSDIPMNTPPGTYPVKDKDGNEIGEITIVEPTEDEPCPSAEYEPTPELPPTQPSCEKDVVVPVTPGVSIVVDGQTYDDNDGDGNVTVPTTALEKDVQYTIETVTGEKIGTIEVDEDCAATIIYTSCMAGEFTAPELAGQTITLTNDQGKAVTVTVGQDGKATVPFINGTFTVTNAAGEEIGTIVLKDCEGEFTLSQENVACTAATISLPGYEAGTTVTASNGSETVTLTVSEELTVTVPFTEGDVTLTIDGKVIGSVTLVDCEGEFVPTINACEFVEAQLDVKYAGQTVTLTFGDVTAEVVVAADGTVTVPLDGTFDGANENGEKISVMVEGNKVADITIEDCKAFVQNVVPQKPLVPIIPIKPINPPGGVKPPTVEVTPEPENPEQPEQPVGEVCNKAFLPITGDKAPKNSFANIYGGKVSLDAIKADTDAGTYDVVDEEGNKIGTLTVVESADGKACSTATFTKVEPEPEQKPEPELPKYPVVIDPTPSGACTEITNISYEVKDENGVVVEKVTNGNTNNDKSLNLLAGTYTIVSEGKVLKEFTVTDSNKDQKVTVEFECSSLVLSVTASSLFGSTPPPKLNIVPIIDGYPKCDEVLGEVTLKDANDKAVVDVSKLGKGDYALVSADECTPEKKPEDIKPITTFPVEEVTNSTPPKVIEVVVEPEKDPTPTPTPTPSVPSYPAMPSVPVTNYAVELNPACDKAATFVYEIYNMNNSLVTTVKQDGNGKIQFTIAAGTYKVVKQGNPTTQFDSITVTGTKPVESFTLTNASDCTEEDVDSPTPPPTTPTPTPDKGVEIVEIKENGVCEANQTYGVYTKDGKFVQNVKTNNEGVAIAFLATGEYVLKDANGNEITTFTVVKDSTNKFEISSTCIEMPNTDNPNSGGTNTQTPPPIITPGGNEPGTTPGTPTTPGET